jgi:hypothetical protein
VIFTDSELPAEILLPKTLRLALFDDSVMLSAVSRRLTSASELVTTLVASEAKLMLPLVEVTVSGDPMALPRTSAALVVTVMKPEALTDRFNSLSDAVLVPPTDRLLLLELRLMLFALSVKDTAPSPAAVVTSDAELVKSMSPVDDVAVSVALFELARMLAASVVIETVSAVAFRVRLLVS